MALIKRPFGLGCNDPECIRHAGCIRKRIRAAEKVAIDRIEARGTKPVEKTWIPSWIGLLLPHGRVSQPGDE
jgi:hypothetical protein